MKMLFWALMAVGAVPANRVVTIDDFEDGDRRASSGVSWISISDDLIGGTSYANLEVTGAANGSRRALKVTGDVAAEGFAGPTSAGGGGFARPASRSEASSHMAVGSSAAELRSSAPRLGSFAFLSLPPTVILGVVSVLAPRT